MPDYFARIVLEPTLPVEDEPEILIECENEEEMARRCRELASRIKGLCEPEDDEPKLTEFGMIYNMGIGQKKFLMVSTPRGTVLFNAQAVSRTEPMILPTEEEAMERIHAIESRVRERIGADTRGYSVELGAGTEDVGGISAQAWRPRPTEEDAVPPDKGHSRLGRILQAIRGE